jgi:4-amino-4-deoxy-L-arabinose transferase-like glycosyltransferase
MVISIVCCGLCLWVFNNLLLLLTPGTSRSSRLIFVGLLCLMAPFFIREGIFGHLTGLTLTLTALWCGLKAIEKPDLPAVMVFAVAVSAVIFVQNLLIALLLPLILIFVGSMVQKRQWGPLFTALAAGAVGVVVAWSFKNEVNFTDEQREWSFFNLFRASFDTTGRHWVINLLYCVFFPLMHPGFCLLLPGLFLLFKNPAGKINISVSDFR